MELWTSTTFSSLSQHGDRASNDFRHSKKVSNSSTLKGGSHRRSTSSPCRLLTAPPVLVRATTPCVPLVSTLGMLATTARTVRFCFQMVRILLHLGRGCCRFLCFQYHQHGFGRVVSSPLRGHCLRMMKQTLLILFQWTPETVCVSLACATHKRGLRSFSRPEDLEKVSSPLLVH